MTYTIDRLNEIFENLISYDNDYRIAFQLYLAEEYKDLQDSRLAYVDIGQISRYIVDSYKSGQTSNFLMLFDAIEHILSNCDADIETLIVVGLFEGIQNIGGKEIDYYTGFDKWLRPKSKVEWNKVIDFWEGKERLAGT